MAAHNDPAGFPGSLSLSARHVPNPTGTSAAATSPTPRSVASRLNELAAFRVSSTSTLYPRPWRCARVRGESGRICAPVPITRRSVRRGQPRRLTPSTAVGREGSEPTGSRPHALQHSPRPIPHVEHAPRVDQPARGIAPSPPGLGVLPHRLAARDGPCCTHHPRPPHERLAAEEEDAVAVADAQAGVQEETVGGADVDGGCGGGSGGEDVEGGEVGLVGLGGAGAAVGGLGRGGAGRGAGVGR